MSLRGVKWIATGALLMIGSALGQIISVAPTSTFAASDYMVYAQTFRNPTGYNVLQSLTLPAYNAQSTSYIPGITEPGQWGTVRLEVAQWDPATLHFTGSTLWSADFQPTNTFTNGLQNYTFTFGTGITLNPSFTYAIGIREEAYGLTFGNNSTPLAGQTFYSGMYDWSVSEFTSPGSNGYNSFTAGSGALAFTEVFSNGLTPVPEPPVPGLVIGVVGVVAALGLRRRRVASAKA